MKRKIVGFGLSGLIGKPLVEKLAVRYECVLLKHTVLRNSSDEGAWQKELEGAYAVINLSGEPIAGKRWTAIQKKELRDSRLNTTRALVDAIAKSKSKPEVFLNASAIGYYGPRGDEALEESAAAGQGFLAALCTEWEKEALRAELLGVRTVLLRTGIVLSKEGGALAKMLPPFQFFIGGSLGSGKQMMSWVHIDDEVNAIVKALEDPGIRGPVNLTAPSAVSMREFAKTLGKVLKRPSCFPVPGIALKLLLGEMSEMLLTGQNVCPRKLLTHGFQFQFPALKKALQDLV